MGLKFSTQNWSRRDPHLVRAAHNKMVLLNHYSTHSLCAPLTDPDHSIRFISLFQRISSLWQFRVQFPLTRPSASTLPHRIEQKNDSNRMFIIPTTVHQSGTVSAVCHMPLERLLAGGNNPLWRQIASDIPPLSIRDARLISVLWLTPDRHYLWAFYLSTGWGSK